MGNGPGAAPQKFILHVYIKQNRYIYMVYTDRTAWTDISWETGIVHPAFVQGGGLDKPLSNFHVQINIIKVWKY